jgi:hypothetical protein
MRLVTFAVPLAPHAAGDTRLVSDAVAVALGKGDYLSSSEPWPAGAPSEAPRKPERPTLQPTRPAGKPRDQRMAR